MEKTITYSDKQVKVACDEKCEKAWGIVARPKEKLSDDDDDVVYLSDIELGTAPVDPGTYEGGQAKPVEKHNIPNKWCVRQCERCVWGDIDKPIQLKDWSKRRYNQPWKHKVIKFIPAEDSEVYQRLVSEDGKIEMGIYPVMYGYRVRAGYVGKMVCELDWCGGDDQSQLELLYSICKNILESKGNFDNIPIRSDIKPFYKDAKFVEEINSLTTKPLEIVKLEPLYESKNKLLKKR